MKKHNKLNKRNVWKNLKTSFKPRSNDFFDERGFKLIGELWEKYSASITHNEARVQLLIKSKEPDNRATWKSMTYIKRVNSYDDLESLVYYGYLTFTSSTDHYKEYEWDELVLQYQLDVIARGLGLIAITQSSGLDRDKNILTLSTPPKIVLFINIVSRGFIFMDLALMPHASTEYTLKDFGVPPFFKGSLIVEFVKIKIKPISTSFTIPLHSRLILLYTGLAPLYICIVIDLSWSSVDEDKIYLRGNPSNMLQDGITSLRKDVGVISSSPIVRGGKYHNFFLGVDQNSIREFRKSFSLDGFKSLQHKRFNSTVPPQTNSPNFSIPNNEKFPPTMDLKAWGDIKFGNNTNQIIVTIPNSKFTYRVTIGGLTHKIDVMVDNKIILTFYDVRQDNSGMNTFKRNLKGYEYHFKDGALIYKSVKRNLTFFKPLKAAKSICNKFIAMDIETRDILINGEKVLSPFCISIFDGEKSWSYYLTDFESGGDMIEEAFKSVLIKKYSGFKIFFHNLSSFDGIIIFKYLYGLSNDVKIVFRDKNMLDIKLIYGEKSQFTVNIRDSLLLLPSSLRSLAKSFNVSQQKGIYPYDFVNSDKVSLDYKGTVPKIKFFSGVEKTDYEEYKSQFSYRGWSLKSETIKYCEDDCKALWQVIKVFQELIFTTFSVDVLSCFTLPSVAMRIFRTMFLKEDYYIPKIIGKEYLDIKEAYLGGAVDVYIPKGKNVYRYDVNSLYPYVMFKYPMPTGNPIFFEGEAPKDGFGYFKGRVTTPKKYDRPILLKKHGPISVAPLGTWEGWWFSEEIKNAEKYGYKFEISKGYLFEKRYIFKEYVSMLYEIKAKSKKGSPLYIIAKLLLNALYGRFGMSPDKTDCLIVDNSELGEIYDKVEVIDQLVFDDFTLVKFPSTSPSNQKSAPNISVPIGAATTAYARIEMSQFKTAEYGALYSDTDSIDLLKPLPKEFVGPQLGKLKLENIFSRINYWGPKCYIGEVEERKEDGVHYKKIIKTKGVEEIARSKISFDQVNKLSRKGYSKTIDNRKMKRRLLTGELVRDDTKYTLQINSQKRKYLYTPTGLLKATEPITINE